MKEETALLKIREIAHGGEGNVFEDILALACAGGLTTPLLDQVHYWCGRIHPSVKLIEWMCSKSPEEILNGHVGTTYADDDLCSLYLDHMLRERGLWFRWKEISDSGFENLVSMYLHSDWITRIQSECTFHSYFMIHTERGITQTLGNVALTIHDLPAERTVYVDAESSNTNSLLFQLFSPKNSTVPFKHLEWI